MEIVNLEKPKTTDEYGLFNLKGMPNVFYRFEYDTHGQAILMEDLFADNQPEGEEFKELSKESSMYKNIQQLLTDYLKKEE